MDKVLPRHAAAEFAPPPDLGDEERLVWLEITRIFKDMGSTKMSDADHELIRQFCQFTVARDRAWKEYRQKPERYTKIVIGISADGKTPRIVLKDSEHYKTWIECNKYLDYLLKEMELNPKSRKIPRNAAASTVY